MSTETVVRGVSRTPHPAALARRQEAKPSEAPKLFTGAEVMARPPAKWLKQGILPEGLSRLYGPPKIGKTFLALDWALELAAAGQLVVYVMGEGMQGINKRLAAWLTEHDKSKDILDRLLIHDGPVNMLFPKAVSDFIQGLGEKRPTLVVIDTLARCFGGGDENWASDMGRFVHHCDLLREKLGCSVLVIHHTGKDAARGARGSSAGLGAVDCDMELSKPGGSPSWSGLFLTNRAMKDFKPFGQITLDLAPVDDSLVVRYTGRKEGVNWIRPPAKRSYGDIQPTEAEEWPWPKPGPVVKASADGTGSTG